MNSIKIAVGTISKLKLRAVANAFNRAGINAKIAGYQVKSDVPKQPFSEKEIVAGATNRAQNALGKSKDADYGLGIESGIALKNKKYFELAACIVVNQKGEIVGEAFSAAVETPTKVVQLIKANDSEAGVVAQELGGIQEKDPFLWYTGKKMGRDKILEDAIFLALCREFLNPEAYK
ncbi:MAG: hypothetical protein A2736_02830 [Candidatus Yanofskybacteria bacterium RIFCSPHIGHO2_01_FULL_41_27]|uniref:inosine/xanthosine triphosphatase n=4 Tax=Parcubacteria group TaxID=1794811 RepID=A0A1F8HVC9_9BACT|nr:MAG: hypothetical protein UU83_C0033G0009 [Candidatus Jorgensenbacteria bacterium GW2011_GWF2_41_8]KKS25567.1 MAG: hypothetical protein UU84_C0040G0008 [Candidatus Yanofskybacteria bacterium GW2011_GWC2_41_9]OGM99767.1 MAG: hypothetical protein A2736_02830 [Candidatus Yanofskybacteria bacterium RIFCSPHIGHO2_01_FULL_41_27]OGN19591.1 MAG: hypothetical protein A3B00_01620 [Candidatus Yanofskybacteria bacterium RIFCSPLOWO2_01_FULL_41_33]OGN40886.1 MAG: hypothetical protein A2606_02780 [Candidatu